MLEDEAQEIVQRLYRYVLHRDPAVEERQIWTNVVLKGIPFCELLDAFGKSEEFRLRNCVTPFFAPGHYYSPIVNPDENVKRYMEAQPARVGESPKEIKFELARMQSFFLENAAFMSEATFTSHQQPLNRYYADNGGFPLGDALILRAMIKHIKPHKIVEVGSGFSTACMLDTLDDLGQHAQLTCIEPFPDRLKSLLRPSDKLEIIESAVQDVPIQRFADLNESDILFIDSTHVVKTGSDVHYELFEILPSLAPGVFIHFHDIPYPFEYPFDWVFDNNYSWNEAYMLRAFLMHNRDYSVFYSNSYVKQFSTETGKDIFSAFPSNPGSSLWLRKEPAVKLRVGHDRA